MHESLHTVAGRPLSAGITGAAFWAAVVVPLLYLPVLTGQLDMLPALPLLVTFHTVCLLIGHSRGASTRSVQEGQP